MVRLWNICKGFITIFLTLFSLETRIYDKDPQPYPTTQNYKFCLPKPYFNGKKKIIIYPYPLDKLIEIYYIYPYLRMYNILFIGRANVFVMPCFLCCHPLTSMHTIE
jgi:hypothetical protein